MDENYGGGGFLFGGNTGYTPETLAGARLKLAQAMLSQGMDTSPIRSPWQGAARMLEAVMGGWDMHQMQGEQNAANQQIMQALSGASGGSQDGGNAFPAAPAPAAQGDSSAATPSPNPDVPDGPKGQEAYAQPSTTPDASQAQDTYRGGSGDMTGYQNAIAGIESGGNYGSIGPTSKTMGRALGKYQIMEANIGPWSQEALGYAVTPDQFLKNPQIQDAVFNHKFGQYVSQYGPTGAAQAWFAGPGGVGQLGRRDVLGTTVAAYGNKFNKAMGQQGTQVASLDPGIGMPAPPNGGGNIQPPQAPGPVAPTPGYVDPTVSAPNYVPPQQPMPQAPVGVPGGGNIPVTSSGINQAIAANGGQQNQRPDTDPTASAPTFDPGRGPYPVPESAYASPSQSPAIDAINAQAPIDPSQSILSQAAPDAAPPPQQTAFAGSSPTTPAPQQESAQFKAGAPWDQPPSPHQQLAQAVSSMPPQQNNAMNSPQFRTLMGVMMNPYASPGARQMAGMMLQQITQPQYDFVTRPDGEVDYVNKRNPALSGMALPARHLPTHVVIGKDPVTQNDLYGWVDPVTQRVTPDAPVSSSAMPPANTVGGSPDQGQPAAPQQAPQQAPPQQAANAPQPAAPTNAQQAQPQQQPATTSQPLTPPSVPGEAYLDEVAKNNPQWAPYAAQARAVLRGDAPLPVGNAATKPADQMVLRLVYAADPKFNQTIAQNRGTALKDFTNGDNPSSSGGLILNLNTAVTHLREAARASEELSKQQVKYGGDPGGSSVLNKGQELLSPNKSPFHTALNNYNTSLTPLSEELTKFYSGAAGTQASRDQLEEDLGPNSTPETRRGAFKVLLNDLQSKADELQRKWHRSMDSPSGSAADFPIVGPEAKMGINYISNLGKQLPDDEQSLQNARDAIIGGAPREAVIQKLQAAKIDPARL